MPLNTDPAPSATSPALPDLPDGWHYTDDLVWDDPRPSHRARMLALGVSIAAILGIVIAALVLWNAAAHYARGVDALKAHSYTTAVNELSSAKLLVVPYRDSQVLADRARYELVAESADQEQALARVRLVENALGDASAAFDAGDASGVVGALAALPADAVRAAVSGSAAVRTAASTLTERLTGAARQALAKSEYGAAGRYAAALLLLEPSAEPAKALAARAEAGQRLTERFARATAAAHGRHWRTALRLALAVTAVRKDFPGAETLVAQARKALAPKPKPKSTGTAPTSTATTATTTPSTSGTSSGPSSQPPPP